MSEFFKNVLGRAISLTSSIRRQGSLLNDSNCSIISSSNASPREESCFEIVFNIGDSVRIIDDVNQVIRQQKGHGEWNPRMSRVIGKVGIIHRRTDDGDYRVKFSGFRRRWTFNPASLELLASAPEQEDDEMNDSREQLYPSLTTLSREESCYINSTPSTTTLVNESSPPKKEQVSMTKLKGLESKISLIEEVFTCGICLERLKSTIFLCGHGACGHCSRSLLQCHMCREPITKKIVIY